MTRRMLTGIRRVATTALTQWDPRARLGRRVSHGENTVFRVEQRPWMLRVHRADYHTPAAIESELWFMGTLREADFRVGAVQCTLDGRRHVRAEGRVVTVIERLTGRIVRQPRAHHAFALGQALRALHDHARQLVLPAAFTRPIWNLPGLVGPGSHWGNLDDAGLDPVFVRDFRARVEAELPLHELILVHHDLHRGNVIWDGLTPGLIDFDDCGLGHPLVDLAIPWGRNVEQAEPLFEGYGGLTAAERRMLPAADLVLMARALPWLISRSDVPKLAAMVEPYRERFVARARSWLAEPS